MAARDLSKRQTPLRAKPQRTFRRETTLPRQGTDRPRKGIYATIKRPDMSGARQLQEMLGLAAEVGTNIHADIQEGKDQENAAAAVEDFLSGEGQDDERFARSRAYRESWMRESAKDMALTVSQTVTEAVQDRLNDEDDPATLEDVEEIVEGLYREALYDETGKPRVVTPEAIKIVSNALTKTKAALMPKAAQVIGDREDLKVMELSLRNDLVEWETGSEIGGDDGRDPLAPLPEGEEPQTAPKRTERRTISLGKPTGRLPLRGAVTSNFSAHRKRGSAGVDIDGKMGDPIEAPAGGTVSVGRDSRSGLFVKIDHGNGVVSTYSHLSKANLKDGDVIKPGDVLGLVGNSGRVSKKNGDGSHLHYRVKVNGRDVDPLSYDFADVSGDREVVITTGGEPVLKAELPEAELGRAGFPVEEWMGKLPPSIDKGKAKKFLIDALTAKAAESGDASILNGLEDAVRTDGTPSFTPDERLKIVQTRDAVRDKARIKAERAERQLQADNAELVIQSIMDGGMPDESWLADQARRGLLDPRQAWGFQRHVEAEKERAVREAQAELAAAEKAEEERLDAAAEVEAIELSVNGGNVRSILNRFADGEFGYGKDAAQRARKLITAANAGAQRRRDTPRYAFWAEKLKEHKPKSVKQRGSGWSLQTNKSRQISSAAYEAMLATFDGLVADGEDPATAYQKATERFAKQTSGGSRASLEDRRNDLIAKAKGR